MKQRRQKSLGRITVDRKIVEMFRDGKSASHIAAHLPKGKGYVIKLRDLAEEYGYLENISDEPKLFRASAKEIPPFPIALFPIVDLRKEKPAETDSILDSHRAWIVERLNLGWSPQTIFEEISVSVPRSNFYRYLERHHLQADRILRSSPEIIHAPGECLQVDWAKLFDVTRDGKRKTIWVFIGVLGHSRYTQVRVVEKCDFETTISVLQSMLQELGGVPRKVTSDNPKVFVNLASKHEPTLNAGFERFASHCGFTVEALPPHDPKKKGKVERSVQLVRRLFESFPRDEYTLEKSQEHIDRKLEIANQRKHGSHGGKPVEIFNQDEKTKLKPLPATPYEIETIMVSKVRQDGYVRFLNKYYRVDQKLKGKEATVIGSATRVSIFYDGVLLEVYDRIRDSFQTKACKDHYKESYEKTLNNHSHYIKQAEAIGANAARFIEIILGRGEGFVDTRVVWGILTLDKKYGRGDIDKACLSAIELGALTLKTVRTFLSFAPGRKRVPENFETTGGKFARPMSEYRSHLRLVDEAT